MTAESALRCAICHTRVLLDEEQTECPDCRLRYHAECWDGIGGCATYGCARAPAPDKPALITQPGEGWGDEKTCPACSETIAASLLLCYCGVRFPYADPMTAAEWVAHEIRQGRVAASRHKLLMAFVIALMGVTAPFAGAWAAQHAYTQRERLRHGSGAWMLLGYGTGVLGLCWTAIFIALGVS